MKKNYLIATLIVLLGVGGYFVLLGAAKSKLPQTFIKETNGKLNVPSGWKTYVNSKYGYSFEYPDSWAYSGVDAESVDLQGRIIVIQSTFVDTVSNTKLEVSYHLSPWGIEYYKSVTARYDSGRDWYAHDRRQLQIAGNNALEAITTIDIGASGIKLNPPLSLTVVDVLDKKQVGEIEMQLVTPQPNSKIEGAKFEQLLNTFKFN
ncbi:MAG: hypothetical protein JSS76_06950 [Bacteroidetes bacterium]|nr:hypothetical protein [Bacteroidota bacterium]